MIRKEYWPRSWDHFTPFPKPGANKYFSDYFFEELNTAVFFDHQNNNMAQNPSQVDGRRALHWIFKWVLLISQSGSCESLLACSEKVPRTVWLKQQQCVAPQSWRREVTDQGSVVWRLLRDTREGSVPSSLACGWPSSSSQNVLLLSSHCPPFMCISMSIPPVYKDVSHIGLDLP